MELKMKLYDLVKRSDDEITVWDKDYDIESYFYGIMSSKDDLDAWDTAMVELSKLLDVVEISSDGVTVNLSEVIEKNINELKNANLFIRCDIDNIMSDIMSILSGNVPEEWLQKFVDVLSGKDMMKSLDDSIREADEIKGKNQVGLSGREHSHNEER